MPIPIQPPSRRDRANGSKYKEIEPVYGEIGLRIFKARKARNVTQAILADYIGMTRSGVALVEVGANRISIAKLLLVAEALDVTPCWLLEGNGEEQDNASDV
jgi:transcriptional regulator with XRE-family HTH domain